LAELSSGPVAEIQKRLPPGAVLAQKTSLNGADLLIFSRTKRTDDPPLLEVKDLVVYRGNRLVLGSRDELGNVHGISFALHRGDTAIMLAANGHGKTTLAEALAGLVKITSGQIRFDGVPIEQMPVWERASRGLLFLQARNHTFADLSVAESLKLAGINVCPQSLKPLLHRRVSQLSLGEKQRLAFECALRRKNYILGVLDEPFSALDGANVQALFEHIQNAQDCAFLICLPNQIRQEI
jgi:branched-chain amino acid transport system ATP-binding protein